MVLHTRSVTLLAVIMVVAVACNSSDAAETSTTAAEASVETLATPDTSAPTSEPTTTTSTPKTVLSAPTYRIVDRIEGSGAGDTVIVLLDPESYSSLTDLDLYDLIAEVVELFPPIEAAHIVDDPGAANVVANPDSSEAERQAVAQNYLARLDNGVQITYLGPFASSGTAVLGS